jgi:hypothetical protein
VSFELKTSPNIEFVFDAISDYENGITIYNAFELNILATGTDWDLYVGAKTAAVGTWNQNAQYSLAGVLPPVSILQMQVRNNSNTPLTSGFFGLTDISTPTYIIGSAAADPQITCPNNGTNAPGSYLVDPNCYTFKIDLKIQPGFDYRPGMYSLEIEYFIVQDL